MTGEAFVVLFLVLSLILLGYYFGPHRCKAAVKDSVYLKAAVKDAVLEIKGPKDSVYLKAAVKDAVLEIKGPIDDAWYSDVARMRAKRWSEPSSSRGTQADAVPKRSQ
ncbi:uncharacterized protein UTRI_01549 [Ustilago trichophora]|uniref:Uncharacterized protein n=1 Tax=Ustilago trichophora TaxID=86804 RepID=A0A5C3DZZ4_9BASI|nr:uncharacterized protein UTRI_01549 [Ustilago trichophora]